MKCPLGALEDIRLQAGKFFILWDFVVMKMEEDARIPIILERPFLATMRAMIDVKNGKFFLHVGDEKVEFHLPQSIANPTLDDSCCRVDVLDKVPSTEAPQCIYHLHT